MPHEDLAVPFENIGKAQAILDQSKTSETE
jgi:hypothetical protein